MSIVQKSKSFVSEPLNKAEARFNSASKNLPLVPITALGQSNLYLYRRHAFLDKALTGLNLVFSCSFP